MLAGAEIAFAEAIRRAGVKVQTRSKSRQSAARYKEVCETVARGGGLGSHLGAIGITESEMLSGAFESYSDQARTWLSDYERRRRRAIREAGLDPDDYLSDDGDRLDASLAVLGASLLTLTRIRLLSGDLLGVEPGEVSGRVPARHITDALHVFEGLAHATLPETADQFPQVSDDLRARALEAMLLEGEGVQTLYVWRWAYYGEPITPFEPHQDLGASDFTTADRYDDPLLANPDAFPLGDFYQPQDHDDCSCEWEVIVGPESFVQPSLLAPVEV